MPEFEMEDTSLVFIDNSYTPAIGMALGTSELFGQDGEFIRTVSLVFIDPDNEMHPILVHPQGELFQYLISDHFRDYLQELAAEIT